MSLVAEKPLFIDGQLQHDSGRVVEARRGPDLWVYTSLVVVGLLLLDVFGGLSYATAAALLAVGGFTVLYLTGDSLRRAALFHSTIDRADLLMIVAVYASVVALYRVAFVFVEGNDLLLFLFFASGLIVGVAAPLVYTVWIRRRSLTTLGLSMGNLPIVATLALLFAAVQFSITFWGYGDLPATKDVVTLLGMALMVGVFEAVFFRGFVQGRLRESFGTAPAVFGAALLYGLYHVGYGMTLEETVFLSGLGIVYALAYATVENQLIMWPLLTPLGSLFAQLEDGALVGGLPWAALLGFADVIGVFALAIWLSRKHERKRAHAVAP